MTTHKGNSGVVRVGGTPTAIAEITSFSVTETEGTVEDTVLGDAARTHMPDELPDWSGTVNCHYYPGDTNGQAACLIGESLAFEFATEGTANGKNKLSGTGIITSRQIGDVANAAIVPLVLQVKGTGALTHGTYSS